MSPEPSLRDEVAAWSVQLQDIVNTLRERRYDVLEIQNLITDLSETTKRLRALHYSLRLYEPEPYRAPAFTIPDDPSEVARAFLSDLKSRYGYTHQQRRERRLEPRTDSAAT